MQAYVSYLRSYLLEIKLVLPGTTFKIQNIQYYDYILD